MNRKYINPVIALLFVTVISGGFAAGLVARQLALVPSPDSPLATRLSSLNEMAPGGGQKVTNRGIDLGPMDTYLTVLKLIRRNYVDRVGDEYDQRFALGSVENMLASLKDPYSRILPAGQRQVLADMGNGNFQGIGVILGARPKTEDGVKIQQLTVVSPIAGGPAEKAGLLPGDRILAIDGKKVVETPSEGRPSQGMKDLIDRLRKEAEKMKAAPIETPKENKPKTQTPAPKAPAKKGSTKAAPSVKPVAKPAPKLDYSETDVMYMNDAMDTLTAGNSGEVTLSVERQGIAKPITMKITRAQFHSEPLIARQVEPGILYLHILQTSDATVEALQKALKDPANSGAKAVVVDLRRSPGGQLDPMVEIAGDLIPGQPVAVMARHGGVREPIKASSHASAGFAKVAVLVDQGTASTSEILASALHERAKAKVIGSTTFGETLIQTAMPLNDGSMVILTTGKLLTPTGTDLTGKGLAPDITVAGKYTGSENNDPALSKAIALLKS